MFILTAVYAAAVLALGFFCNAHPDSTGAVFIAFVLETAVYLLSAAVLFIEERAEEKRRARRYGRRF